MRVSEAMGRGIARARAHPSVRHAEGGARRGALRKTAPEAGGPRTADPPTPGPLAGTRNVGGGANVWREARPSSFVGRCRIQHTL